MSVKNDRIISVELGLARLEKILNENIVAWGQAVVGLQKEIRGLKENELEHIYDEMQEMRKVQEAIREFQARIKGAVKMATWIISTLIALVGLALRFLK